jgi:DNA-binding MarR family transcriptional regulator
MIEGLNYLALSSTMESHMAGTVAREKRTQAAAAEVWRLMAEFAFAKFQGGEHMTLLQDLGLTPGHMKALSILDPDQPKPMRAMADTLGCDASMVTWLVDRLEERGLVERRMLPTDRRVKTVVLTRLGIQTRERLAEALSAPPPALLALDLPSLETLRDELRKLPPPERKVWSGLAPPPSRAGAYEPRSSTA